MSGSSVYFKGKWKSQTFTSSGTFNVPEGVDTLFVELHGAGGGGGGGGDSFGGEAGEYVTGTISVTPLSTVSVVIGAGGQRNLSSVSPTKGENGGDTTCGPLRAKGGLGGALGGETPQDFYASILPTGTPSSNRDLQLGFGIGRPGIRGDGGVFVTPAAGNGYPGDGGWGNGGRGGRTNPNTPATDGGIGAGGGGLADSTTGGDGGDGICVIWYKQY